MKWVWGILFVVAIAMGSMLIWQRFGLETGQLSSLPRMAMTNEGTVLAVFGPAPDFSLTERSGGPFSKKDLSGKPWIADFIFTSCAGQCPLMSLQMKKFQDQLGPAGFRFVSFTVDPDRDTPEVLAQYADRYRAEKEQWFFLTGPKNETNRVLKEFFLSPVEEPAMHSIRFILVDEEGRIRGYYDSSETGSVNQLLHDAKILIQKKELFAV